MEQVSTAIQTVSSTTEDTVANSEGILKSVNEVVYSIDEIVKASQSQAELAEKLNNMVAIFKV